MKKRIIVFALAAVLLLAAIGCANPALPKEGTYTIGVTLTGGTGKAKIQSPAELVVFQDGHASLVVIWSSDKYDKMVVNYLEYEPEIIDGQSVFVIPVTGFDYKMSVQAETTAMSEPHMIDYTLYFDSSTLVKQK